MSMEIIILISIAVGVVVMFAFRTDQKRQRDGELREQVRQLWREGYTLAEIVKMTGADLDDVAKHYRKVESDYLR